MGNFIRVRSSTNSYYHVCVFYFYKKKSKKLSRIISAFVISLLFVVVQLPSISFDFSRSIRNFSNFTPDFSTCSAAYMFILYLFCFMLVQISNFSYILCLHQRQHLANLSQSFCTGAQLGDLF